MNHVEYLTFLAFRTFETAFSFNIKSKLIIASVCIVHFFVFLFAIIGYRLYYGQYKKLAKYFLINLKRFPKSYILMTIIYGVSPFVKGCIRAVLYENWELQLILLSASDIVIVCVIGIF